MDMKHVIKLDGDTATLCFTYFSGIKIKIDDSGDGLYYQYIHNNEYEEIKEAEIFYIDDVENITGYGDDPGTILQPAFIIENDSSVYFLSEFICDNYWRK